MLIHAKEPSFLPQSRMYTTRAMTNTSKYQKLLFYRHVGDWANLVEDDLNPTTIRYKFTDYLASLSGKYSIYGRALVVSIQYKLS